MEADADESEEEEEEDDDWNVGVESSESAWTDPSDDDTNDSLCRQEQEGEHKEPLSQQEQEALLQLKEDEVVAFVSFKQLRAGAWLQHFSDNLRIIRTAVLCHARAFHHASEELRANKELTMLAVSKVGLLLKDASAELRDDVEVVTTAVWADPHAFRHASERMRANRDLAIAAVSQRPHLLQYASSELRDDKAVVQTAITRSPIALKHASNRLRSDPDLLLLALPDTVGDMSEHGYGEGLQPFRWRNKWLLKFLRRKDFHNMTLLSALVTRRGLIYGQLPKEAQSHRELAVLAVSQWGPLLEHAPETLRDDFSLVETAVIQDARAFEYASARLRGDRRLAMLAVRRCGSTLKHALDDLRDDDTVVKAAVSQEGSAYEFASSRLRGNRNLAMLAVSKEGGMLRHVPSLVESDRTLVAAALKSLVESSKDQAEDISAIMHLMAWPKLERVSVSDRLGQIGEALDTYSKVESLCKTALSLPPGSTVELYSGNQKISRYDVMADWPGASRDCVAELDLVRTKRPRIAG